MRFGWDLPVTPPSADVPVTDHFGIQLLLTSQISTASRMGADCSGDGLTSLGVDLNSLKPLRTESRPRLLPARL